MKLSKEEVEHIAALARLSLTAEEIERYRQQLSSILGHISQLQEIDTTEVPPLTSVWAKEMPLREDTTRPGLGLGPLLRNAPDINKEQFKVPPILDGKDE